MLQPGDWVLLLDPKARRYLVRLMEGGRFGHHVGGVTHEQIMAAGYGGRVRTTKDAWLWVLRPSLEDYVLLMKRGATVTYPKDAAAIVLLLDLAPGERVLEAGSGSGALALFLARAVGPAGEVVSYERRADFLARARENVEAWGTRNVDFRHGDLAEAALEPEGFDGVALDVMEPWKVLATAVRALKTGRSLVLYLPNITQVVQAVREAAGQPLLLRRVIEVGHRDWDVRPPVAHPHFRQVGHTAFLAQFTKVRPVGGQAQHEEESGGEPQSGQDEDG
ncbi:tRNA (adenine-N1)-methyltransferase [Oceanithermus desulfurans]